MNVRAGSRSRRGRVDQTWPDQRKCASAGPASAIRLDLSWTVTYQVKITDTYHIVSLLIFLILDPQGQRKRFALIQYMLHGPEVEIKIKPHGRSKNNQPFFRTSTSTRKRISELAMSSTPKTVISDLTKEKGASGKLG